MTTIIPAELTAEEKEYREKLRNNIRLILKTGKLRVGFRNVIRALQRGEAKMVIIALNIPKDKRAMITYFCSLANVPMAVFPGTSRELGEACGRPHLISTLVILDVGTSEILELGHVPSL